MALQAIAFYLLAAVTIAAGFGVVSARNPVHSVLFLILAFFFILSPWGGRRKTNKKQP